MSKFTPGPWQTTPRFQDKIDVIHCGPDCNKPGAATKVVARVNCRDTWRAEQEANARLIAAAPELLEALQELLASVKGVPCGPEAKCHAAINKATGEP